MHRRAFYKPYKSRKASAGIQELWNIDNWEAASISKEAHVANREATNATTPTTVLHQARKYYVWLFSAKEHLLETDALNTFARCLTTNPIPLAAREACELAISDKEIAKSIRKAPLGKACGPDGLPVELFRVHASELVPILTGLFAALHSKGALTDTMEEGELTLLYKKKERCDIRNYRPITLLNSDLKILTATLARRVASAVSNTIMGCQTGFMHGRFIADNTQTTQLLQAIQEEDSSESTAFIALDQEKAFDRISWRTLNLTFQRIGFGANLCKWINTIYNLERPLRRRIRCGAETSEWYHIKSGVPQGLTQP